MKVYFLKNRYFYLGFSIFFFCVAFIAKGPFYEAFVDVSISPPESIRKTDFSWITVNEWFNSQKYIITSYAILKKANVGIDEEKLKEMVFVRRVGAADIIRISVMADYRPEMLISISDAIAKTYVSTLNRSVVTAEGGKLPIESKDLSEVISAYARDIRSLREERENIKNKLKSATDYEALCEAELDGSFADSGRASEINKKVSQLDDEISKIMHKASILKEQYTDNWPEIVDLNGKINSMKTERAKLISRIDGAVRYDEKKGMLSVERRAAKVASDGNEKQLDLLEVKIENLEDQKSAAEARIGPSKPAYSEIPDEVFNKKEGAFILNPPAIDFLPDLWWQLIKGVFSGFFIWAVISGVLSIKKKY